MKNEIIETIDTPFRQVAVLICSRCSEKSDELRAELKPLLKEKYEKSVRCMSSSCQGICPKNKIAITKISNGQLDCFQSYEVCTEITAQELINKLF